MEESCNGHNGHLPINLETASNRDTKLSIPGEQESLITADLLQAARSQRNRYCMRRAIVICLTVTSMILSLLSLLISLWVHGKTSAALPVAREGLCVPCKLLEDNPPGFATDLQQLTKISSSQETRCCAENDEQIQVLLRLVSLIDLYSINGKNMTFCYLNILIAK